MGVGEGDNREEIGVGDGEGEAAGDIDVAGDADKEEAEGGSNGELEGICVAVEDERTGEVDQASVVTGSAGARVTVTSEVVVELRVAEVDEVVSVVVAEGAGAVIVVVEEELFVDVFSTVLSVAELEEMTSAVLSFEVCSS